MRNHTDLPRLQEAVYQDGRRKEKDSKLGISCWANLVWLEESGHADTVLSEGRCLQPGGSPERTPLTQRWLLTWRSNSKTERNYEEGNKQRERQQEKEKHLGKQAVVREQRKNLTKNNDRQVIASIKTRLQSRDGDVRRKHGKKLNWMKYDLAKEKRVKSITRWKPNWKYHKWGENKQTLLKTKQWHEKQDREAANYMEWKFLKMKSKSIKYLKRNRETRKWQLHIFVAQMNKGTKTGTVKGMVNKIRWCTIVKENWAPPVERTNHPMTNSRDNLIKWQDSKDKEYVRRREEDCIP